MSNIIKHEGDVQKKDRPGQKLSAQDKLKQSRHTKATLNESAATMPERIAVVADCSGSMNSSLKGRKKIYYLIEATQGFLQAIEWHKTSVAIRPFPEPGSAWGSSGNASYQETPLLCDPTLLNLEASKFTPTGGTPIGPTLRKAIEDLSLTRALLISDGEADELRSIFGDEKSGEYGGRLSDDEMATATSAADSVVGTYRECKIPIDCVHVGDEHAGEATLTRIARETGGIFIKFEDVTSFAKNLKYLTPTYRGLLSAPGAAERIGAKEVK